MQKTTSITGSANPKAAVQNLRTEQPSAFFRPFIPPKSTINLPNDEYGQEACMVSERLMRMCDTQRTNQSFFKPAFTPVQRKCAHCEEEEQQLQRREINHSTATAEGELSTYVSGLPEGGQPLSKETRGFFEPRMGQDFSNVRVHTGSGAAKSAQSINALAYTTGRHIVFNSGQFSPDTEPGKRLLGHELTHVVQQKAAGQALIQRFEGHEHQYFGDRGLSDLYDYLTSDEGGAWAAQYGYNVQQLLTAIASDRFYRGGRLGLRNSAITPGEAISLSGDFYETWQGLENAPAAGLRSVRNPDGSAGPEGILDIMSREERGTISSAGATLSYSNITAGRYLDLAQRNVTHFSPENRAEWLRLHTEAKQMAAGSAGDAAVLNRALLIDAAAGHFLTDAFAAGHLINRNQVLARIHTHLAANPVRTTNPEMQTFVAVAAQQGAIDQLVLKLIHDHFNATGLEVTNNKGMRWRTFGDDHLHNAIETQHIGSLAVFLSRLQVVNAAAGNQSSDNEVLDLLPLDSSLDNANLQAFAYIPRAVQDVERIMMSNRQAAEAALGPVLGPIVRFYMNGIEARASATGALPSATGSDRSVLIPPVHIGLDFNPWVDRPGPERNISFGIVGGVDPNAGAGIGVQGGLYGEWRF